MSPEESKATLLRLLKELTKAMSMGQQERRVALSALRAFLGFSSFLTILCSTFMKNLRYGTISTICIIPRSS